MTIENAADHPVMLSVIVPCYNEESTIDLCVERLLRVCNEQIALEVIIVDDNSKDGSLARAKSLAANHSEVRVLAHGRNMGKGAALRTGFAAVTGDIVAVQDADLEYDPMDLRRLVQPIMEDRADVVFGSRFLSAGEHRVLYFWHYLTNKALTFLSNMFSDLNLTDMETCYKLFRREIIDSITIEEDRFGFEPEIVAKVAQLRVRIIEMGISYYGRTYEEGKKIGWRDGIRALYCIFHYNAPKAPAPIQFAIYILIGALAALFNLLVFLVMIHAGLNVCYSAGLAYSLAAVMNYFLCIAFLFRHKARWSSKLELAAYVAVVVGSGLIDLSVTKFLSAITSLAEAKIAASALVLIINFYGRKYLVFPEKPSGKWKPQKGGPKGPSTL